MFLQAAVCLDCARVLPTRRSYLYTRINVPVNLTYVLLSLVYEHGTGAVVGEFRSVRIPSILWKKFPSHVFFRFVRITIRDVFGDDSPTVVVTLRHVGSNNNRPIVNITSNFRLLSISF